MPRPPGAAVPTSRVSSGTQPRWSCSRRRASLPADEARALGLVNRVAPAGVDLLEFVDRFLEPMRERPPHVMRALKAQALAERFGWSVEVRREAEREHFVRAWLDPAHWAAVDDRFKPPPARSSAIMRPEVRRVSTGVVT